MPLFDLAFSLPTARRLSHYLSSCRCRTTENEQQLYLVHFGGELRAFLRRADFTFLRRADFTFLRRADFTFLRRMFLQYRLAKIPTVPTVSNHFGQGRKSGGGMRDWATFFVFESGSLGIAKWQFGHCKVAVWALQSGSLGIGHLTPFSIRYRIIISSLSFRKVVNKWTELNKIDCGVFLWSNH